MGITAAVIGCGNISRFHFSGLEKAGPKVKWVCDLDEEAMGPWAKQFEAQVTADFREALADPEVDVVHVTLISSLHKRICLEAIAAGKAAVCEKTLTESATDSLEIVQAAEKGKVDLVVVGTRGRGGLERLMLGSVADKVIRSVPCPVLTVRGPVKKTSRKRKG